MIDTFPPTRQAALDRLNAVRPSDYARSRNAIEGAVTGLSPYITHGLISLPEVLAGVTAKHSLDVQHKFVFELGWREYFRHVWAFRGEEIFESLREGLLPKTSYSALLPEDIRQADTGVPVIDMAVRTLYATGYLHNHARMWLASYVVHVRKVEWRIAADWLYGHLLDGDLASNHLSWQWVAGTGSSKPYVFNAENVMKFAPASARPAWDCTGTVIDKSYEALDDFARNRAGVGAEPGAHEKVAEPPLSGHFYDANSTLAHVNSAQAAIKNIANKKLELVHPWALSQRLDANTLRIGVVHLPAHSAWPWSEQRWRFVLDAMAHVTDGIWFGDLAELDVSAASSVTAQATLFPGYRTALPQLAKLISAPRLLPDLTMACRSFSKFYEHARRDAGQFSDLLLRV